MPLGAATVALAKLGVSTQLIFTLGDWKSWDSFLRHYHKLLADTDVAMTMLAAAAVSPSHVPATTSVVGTILEPLPAYRREGPGSPASASDAGETGPDQGEQARGTICPPSPIPDG
jgi:hypothetical protein